jgi:co-chaperonin GroES (HSP10)
LDRVLVQRAKAEARTAGGIFLPEASVKELNEAKVLAVGPGAFDKDGKRIAVSVKPGDRVLIPQVRVWQSSALGLGRRAMVRAKLARSISTCCHRHTPWTDARIERAGCPSKY